MTDLFDIQEAGLHNAYVQTIQTGGFFASCPRCGCGGFPNRKTRAEAEADAAGHKAAWHTRVGVAAERIAANAREAESA